MAMDMNEDYTGQIQKLKTALREADAVIIGAGAGLSTSAGFIYTGERFERYFSDFAAVYHFTDMYSGGFTRFRSLEEQWAYWSRYIFINRYTNPPESVYSDLLNLVRDKDYFVLTTNVDHCFQRAGFDKNRLFYTQGDYGLWQCSKPCHQATYDNEETVRKMVEAQGFRIDETGTLYLPEGAAAEMTVPQELVPRCPRCGEPMSMNLRADDTFVEDEGWHRAADRYQRFLESHEGKIVFWEIGVGFNTPVIIKYPFWRMTYANQDAVYVCMNYDNAFCPEEIARQSICVDGDTGKALKLLLQS